MIVYKTPAALEMAVKAAAKASPLDTSLDELRTLAQTDLGDFVAFEFAGAEPIKVEDEYRSGLKVTFVPLLGGKRLQEVSIDLVVDRVASAEPEIVKPADRIEVTGIPTRLQCG